MQKEGNTAERFSGKRCFVLVVFAHVGNLSSFEEGIKPLRRSISKVHIKGPYRTLFNSPKIVENHPFLHEKSDLLLNLLPLYLTGISTNRVVSLDDSVTRDFRSKRVSAKRLSNGLSRAAFQEASKFPIGDYFTSGNELDRIIDALLKRCNRGGLCLRKHEPDS